jgi:chromosome segregation ATPase
MTQSFLMKHTFYILDAQKAMISAESKAKSLKMKMEPLKTQLKDKKEQLRRIGGNLGNEQAELQNLERGIGKLQVHINKNCLYFSW